MIETVAFLDHHLDTRPDDLFFASVTLGGIHNTPYSLPDEYNANEKSLKPVVGEYSNDYYYSFLKWI